MSEPVQVPPPSAGELVIVVPVYNEADNIRPLVEEVERWTPPPFTLRVVYDFDEDTTLPVVRELQRTRPWLELLRNELGRGVVYALKAGFASVERGPVLVMMGDLSDDLSSIPRMLELYRTHHVVCPSRYMKGGEQIGGPLVKKTLSRAAGVSLHRLAGFPTADATNNFRLYDAQMVRELGVESSAGFEVALELTAKAFRAGYRVTQLPAVWRDRTAGESRFALRKWLPNYLYWYVYALTGRRPP
jgi:glycosyltransferase involved in cell wall biosynthesis